MRAATAASIRDITRASPRSPLRAAADLPTGTWSVPRNGLTCKPGRLYRMSSATVQARLSRYLASRHGRARRTHAGDGSSSAPAPKGRAPRVATQARPSRGSGSVARPLDVPGIGSAGTTVARAWSSEQPPGLPAVHRGWRTRRDLVGGHDRGSDRVPSRRQHHPRHARGLGGGIYERLTRLVEGWPVI